MYVKTFDFLNQDIFYVRQIIDFLTNFEFDNYFIIDIDSSCKRLLISFT